VSLKDGEERVGEVLQKVEPVGHLDSLRRTFGGSFGIGASAITGNDADAWMFFEPVSDRLNLTIFEQRDWALSLQVNENGAVALAFLPGPVVDPDHFGSFRFR
jgi:hypothetical protein